MSHTHVKTFKTTVLGCGPHCIEFHNGEIVQVNTKENFNLIVQAVNSFEAMREVLEELTRDIEAVGVKETGKEWPDLLVTYNKAKQALAAAEGKEVGR